MISDAALAAYGLEQLASAVDILMSGDAGRLEGWVRDNFWIADLVTHAMAWVSGKKQKTPTSADEWRKRASKLKELFQASGLSARDIAQLVLNTGEGQAILSANRSRLDEESGAAADARDSLLREIIPSDTSIPDWLDTMAKKLGWTIEQVYDRRATLLGIK
jgi:hypothetical protein